MVNNRLNGEIKRLKSDLNERDQSQKRFISESNKQQEIIKDQKEQIFDLESRLELLGEEKSSYSHKMELHLQ